MMRLRLKTFLILAASVTAALCATAAAAQDDAALLRDAVFARDRNVSVTQRPKPEYQPISVRVGAITIDPMITAGVEYNDNVYAQNIAKRADGVVHIQPSITVTSDWSRNQVSAFARASSNLYFDHSGEDTTDGAIGASGRLDVQRGLGFAGGASFERDTQPRTSEASPEAAAHPVRYDVEDVWVEGTKEFNRLRLTARGSIDDYSYDNAKTANDFQIYEQDQDHSTYVGALQAEYAYLPEMSFLLSLLGNHREYRYELPAEVGRTSSGYEATVGANFDLSHLARGEVYIGYLEQDYNNDSVFRNVSGLAVRGKVEYFPTQLTTVAFSGSRSVQDSGIINVGEFLANTAAVQVDHELLRNLIFSADVSYSEDNYQNYNRTDKITGEQVSVKYLMNRAISLNLSYSHLDQDSRGSNAGPKYEINRVIGSLVYHF